MGLIKDKGFNFGSGDFWQASEAGDYIDLLLQDAKMEVFTKNNPEKRETLVLYGVDNSTGEETKVSCGSYRLRDAVGDADPNGGDIVRVTYLQQFADNSKDWKVEVFPGTQAPTTAPQGTQAPTTAPPAAPAAPAPPAAPVAPAPPAAPAAPAPAAPTAPPPPPPA